MQGTIGTPDPTNRAAAAVLAGSSAATDAVAVGTLTFLFTDLAGSTRLWEQAPLAMQGALARHDGILRAAVEAASGRVVKSTGDGMMAVFSSAGDAVAASLSAQRSLAAESWPEIGILRVRMGIHAGDAERRLDDYFGPTVNRTARLMAVAHGGQVLLSSSAASLAADRLPPDVSLLDLGEHRLKDLGRPERVYQLVHPELVAEFPPIVTAGRAAAELPEERSPFIGREAELAAIERHLADPTLRLLTLTGPGGTGKTTLAIRAATKARGRFRDGARFVDLSTARDSGAVIAALARMSGVGDVSDRPIFDALVDRLHEWQVLLVLDNFEQVTTAAGVVADLLRDCPGVTALVTSREALHVRHEQVLAVPTLGLPPDARRASVADLGRSEAVQLFVGRARAVRPEFELTDENAAAVAEICQRLDGLPLAIELAAARLRLFSPEALRDRLTRGLDVLRASARDLPERQQTLHSTIEWSYELLAPGEQLLFETLAVFADCDVTAVEAVVAGIDNAKPGDHEAGLAPSAGIDAIDGLASLLEKSLVRQVDLPDAEPRVSMLATIRQYAAVRLDSRGSLAAAVRRAHAEHYAELSRTLRRDLVGADRDRALSRMALEIGNLRIAWQHWMAESDLDQLQKLADSMLILYDARGWYLDCVDLTRDLLAVLSTRTPTAADARQEIALRTSLARALMATRGYTPEVEDAYTRALELFERGDLVAGEDRDIRQHFGVLRALSSLYLLRAEFVKGERLGRRILELADLHDDPAMRLEALLVVGSMKVFMSDPKDGLVDLDRAIELLATMPKRSHAYRLGNDPGVACMTTSAFALWLLGFPDRALARAHMALDRAAEIEHPFTSAFARFHAGLVHLFRREPELARDRALAALEVADEHDFQVWTAVGNCLLGAAQAVAGRPDEGLANLRAGLSLYQETRTPPIFWPMLRYLEATACLVANRPEQGLTAVDVGIGLFGERGGSILLPEFQILRGDLLASDHGPTEAAIECYRLALDGAIGFDTLMSQIRATTRLWRIAASEGDRDAAADQLAAAVARLTEGFETPDVLDAVAVLEQAKGPTG
jgi:predicted ATPase/class 3 adenylate cyclase